MGIQVLVHEPEALDKIRTAEMDVCKIRCKKIIDSGANVVLCARGIDDFALKYFVEAGVIAIRRVPKSDLKRIANNTGAKVVVSLADIEGLVWLLGAAARALSPIAPWRRPRFSTLSSFRGLATNMHAASSCRVHGSSHRHQCAPYPRLLGGTTLRECLPHCFYRSRWGSRKLPVAAMPLKWNMQQEEKGRLHSFSDLVRYPLHF